MEAVLPSFRRYAFHSNLSSSGHNERPRNRCHYPFSWRENVSFNTGNVPMPTRYKELNQQVQQIHVSNIVAGELWYTDGRHVTDIVLLINTATFSCKGGTR
jgi:hypothetical protein